VIDPPDTAATDAGVARPVVFLGDSITEAGPWAEAFPDLRIGNAGRSGDTTTDVEERVDDVVAQNPSVVVLMVGTNDFGLRANVEQVVRGTENILFKLRAGLPDTRIVVASVLPRERERADWIKQVNIHVRQFAPTVKAEFLDLWNIFAEEDGELRAEFTSDRLHLNSAGYAAWIEQLRPIIG
jgi:lysophospholipase L1-like esterase